MRKSAVRRIVNEKNSSFPFCLTTGKGYVSLCFMMIQVTFLPLRTATSSSTLCIRCSIPEYHGFLQSKKSESVCDRLPNSNKGGKSRHFSPLTQWKLVQSNFNYIKSLGFFNRSNVMNCACKYNFLLLFLILIGKIPHLSLLKPAKAGIDMTLVIMPWTTFVERNTYRLRERGQANKRESWDCIHSCIGQRLCILEMGMKKNMAKLITLLRDYSVS